MRKKSGKIQQSAPMMRPESVASLLKPPAYRGEEEERNLSHVKCFICGTRAPWLVWGGQWRPVCRRHFVVMRWDTLSVPERGRPRHPDLEMAYLEYVEETERGSAREREYLAGATRGIT